MVEHLFWILLLIGPGALFLVFFALALEAFVKD